MACLWDRHHRRTRLSRANIHSKPFVTEVNVDVDRFQRAFIEDDKTRHFPVYFTKDGQLSCKINGCDVIFSQAGHAETFELTRLQFEERAFFVQMHSAVFSSSGVDNNSMKDGSSKCHNLM